MAEKVLIYSRFPKSQMVRIGEHFDLLDAAGKPPLQTFSADQLKDVRALITAGGQVLKADVMDMMPALGAIICYGTGYDGVDFKAAAERKIVVGNSPGANAASVADLALTADARGDAALAACGSVSARGWLVVGKAVAADVAAARQSRPQSGRLWHGRDRPQDRVARRGLRMRRRLSQPQQA